MNRQRNFWFALWLAALVAACSNPLSKAQTPEQQAYAVYAQFVILEEEAAAWMFSDQLTAEQKDRIRRADAVAKPLADSLLEAVLYVEEQRSKVAAGEATVDQLQVAIRALIDSQASADNAIAKLAKVLEGL